MRSSTKNNANQVRTFFEECVEMNMNQVAILAQATRASQMEYESLEAFLKDRQLDHATVHGFASLSQFIAFSCGIDSLYSRGTNR